MPHYSFEDYAIKKIYYTNLDLTTCQIVLENSEDYITSKAVNLSYLY